jgi:murein DD-endopeptidase MepM/ murein hydrolase activator NlpD
LGLFLLPLSSQAGILSSFTDKIKSVINKDDTDDDKDPNAQTMQVLKPLVVEKSDLSPVVDDDQETLTATTGSLRLSNEELDIPLNDTISLYEVKKGDTLATVAKLFGVSKNTIVWANDIKNGTITPGDTLIILPITGIKHTVKKGDTLASVAKKYKADPDDIAKYNGLAKDAILAAGDVILVPEGEIVVAPKVDTTVKKPATSKLATAPLGFFVRPLVGGIKTQGIHGHNAVDIAAKVGTPIVATASGKVIIAKVGGYNGGYGNMIVIMHENNIQTLYAHMKEIYVANGATVTQGQVIGAVGLTGKTTGPHLHIEVRGAVNPF